MKFILTAAVFLSLIPSAFAEEARDLSKIIPNPQMGREWPLPTAEEALKLPAAGCKPVYEISVPKERAERMKWYKSDDGKCNSWYKLHLIEVKMVDPEAAKIGDEALRIKHSKITPQ